MRRLNVPPVREKLGPPVTAEEARAKRAAQKEERTKRAAAAKPRREQLASTVPGPASIAELTRALKNDVDLIFRWVHDNVDFYCQADTRKGALGSLIDRIAGPFDQATLMVTSLREAGYTASYVVGSIRLTAAQLANLLGTIDTSSSYPSLDVLNGCYVPNTPTFDDSGNLLYVDLQDGDLGYCWVQVNIDGTDYVFDPSLKTYNRTTSSLDFASITGFDLDTLQTNAQQGATFADDGSWIQNLNIDTFEDVPGVRPLFTSYATNLLNWIQTNNFAASMNDILGGTEILPLPPGPLRQTSLPYQTPGSSVEIYPGDLDPSYRDGWRITYAGIDVSENLDEYYGQRVTITFTTATSGNVIPTLKANGVVLGVGTEQTPNTDVTAFISSNIPQNIYTDPNGIYFCGIINAPPSQSMVDYHRQILQQNMAAGGASTDEDVLGESLAIVFYGYNVQHFMFESLLAQLGSVHFAWTQFSGLVGYNSVFHGPYTDFFDSFNTISLVGDFAGGINADAAAQYLLSAFEGGIQQQTFGTIGISTLRYLVTAISLGQKIFATTKFNWEEGDNPVEPQLVNWDTWISYITDRVQAKRLLFLHQDGATQVGSTAAGGWIENLLGTPSYDFVIVPPAAGGGNSEPLSPGQTNAGAANGPNSTTTGDQGQGSSPCSCDPVSLFSGDYFYNRADLSVGSGGFPYSLEFTRNYDSGSRFDDGPLGFGWTHNFATNISSGSNGVRGLGEISPKEAAAAIAAAYGLIQLAIYNNETYPYPSELTGLIASTIGVWLMDEISNNAVVLNDGAQSMTFIELVDGSYNPPPGYANTLAQNMDGTFTLKNPQQQTWNFNLSPGAFEVGSATVGGNPGAIAIIPDGTKAYVANASLSEVTVVVTVTNAVSTTISLGQPIKSVVASPDGTKVFAGNTNVWIIDTSTDTESAEISIGSGVNSPASMAITPDGTQLYAANFSDGTVSVIDTSTNTVSATITVGTEPNAIAVSPDGLYAYVLNNGSATVSVIDTSTNTVSATIAVGNGPSSLVITPDSSQVYVTNNTDGTVSVINSSTVIATVSIGAGSGPNSIAITPNGAQVYVANDNIGMVSVIDTATNTVLATVTVGSSPAALGTSPDGTEVYVLNMGSNSVSVINTSQNNVTATVAVGAEPFLLAITPDGGQVYVCNTTTVYLTVIGVVKNYDQVGKASTYVDPAGVTVTYNYNNRNQLTSVSNGLSRTLTLDYTGNLLFMVSDGNARSVSFVFDESNNLTSSTDANGNTTTYAYGAPGQLTQYFLPANPAVAYVTNVFDSLGRVMSQTPANEGTSSYYFAGSRAEVVDPLGNSHVMYYNSLGSTVRDINQLGQETDYVYDGLNRVVSITFPELNTIASTYDNSNNMLNKTWTPKPGISLSAIVQSFTYDSYWNKVSSFTDGVGNTTSFSYDATQGTLLTITRPTIDGMTPTVTFTYNSRGQVLTSIDETGVVDNFVYDTTTEELLTATHDFGTGHLNLATQFGYDEVGNVNSSTDPNGNTTTFEFDSERRLIQRTECSPFGYVTTWGYDENGNQISTQKQTNDPTQPLQTWNFAYLANNTLEVITDPASNQLTFSYNSNNWLVTRTDAEDREWQYSYDGLGRVIIITDPLSNAAETKTYTNNGFVSTIEDARSNVTTFQYDGFDRLSQQLYPDATFVQYSYDANSRLLTLHTRDGVAINNTYDVLTRLSTRQPGSLALQTMAYDLAGRPTQISTPVVSGDPASGNFQLTYDSAGRLIEQTMPNGNIVAYQLDANGNRTRLIWPDGYYAGYVFDSLNRLTGIMLNGSTSPTISFEYDALSRRTQVNYSNACVCAYAYALNNDMTGLEQNFVGSSVTFSFDYNNVHQVTGLNVTDSSFVWEPGVSATTPYSTANDLNQYPAVGGTAFGYDNNGCLTGGPLLASFDALSRMIKAISGGNRNNYFYDPLNRQAQKQVSIVNPTVANVTVGSDPDAVAITPDGTKAYVCNIVSSTVSVINTATNAVSATVTVGADPYDLAITPDGSKVYVANIVAGTVSVINTPTNTVSATVTVGSSPFALAITPDSSKVYVANLASNTVSVISTSSNTVIATVTVGGSPYAVAITPGGTKAYVPNSDDGTVSVINTSSNTISATVTVGSSPGFVVITPDGTKAYVANSGGSSVSVINTSSNTVSATVTVGTEPFAMAVTPDGSKVYVVNLVSHTVSVINTATNTVSATISIGTAPFAIAMSSDGTRAYVANEGAHSVSVINTATNAVVSTVTVGTAPVALAVTPDSSKVFVANEGSGTVSVINAFTSTHLLYDGQQLIADYDGSGSLLHRYLPAGPDEVLGQIAGSILTFNHTDRIGSIIAQTNASGSLVNKYQYSPFGETPSLTGSIFGFTGQRYDSEIGLYYYKARCFSPTIGRFSQPDPIGYSAGDLNLYSYVNNDPVNLTDPSGLQACNACNAKPTSLTVNQEWNFPIHTYLTVGFDNGTTTSTGFYPQTVNGPVTNIQSYFASIGLYGPGSLQNEAAPTGTALFSFPINNNGAAALNLTSDLYRALNPNFSLYAQGGQNCQTYSAQGAAAAWAATNLPGLVGQQANVGAALNLASVAVNLYNIVLGPGK